MDRYDDGRYVEELLRLRSIAEALETQRLLDELRAQRTAFLAQRPTQWPGKSWWMEDLHLLSTDMAAELYYRCVESAAQVARALFQEGWSWAQFGESTGEDTPTESCAPPFNLVANTTPGRAPPLRSLLFWLERSVGDSGPSWAAGVA